MYRRLLIPVARPAEVEPLIRFGSMLLDADGDVRLLHVISNSSLPAVTREWRSSVNIVVPAHEMGAALDIRVDPEVRASTDVPGEILDSAEAHETDAILMTLRADRRERNPLVGHTASAILQHARCDVLIVNRLALAGERVPRILVPSFNDTPPPKTMRLAEELSVHSEGIPIVALALGLAGPGGGRSRSLTSHSPRGVPLVRRRSPFAHRLLGRRRRLPELILAQAAQERYGLLLVGEDAQHPEGPVLTRRFLDELFRKAPCPVVAIRG
jgi:nucleotide-binding universal stress UspA family protein